jgi:hypothetical protein
LSVPIGHGGVPTAAVIGPAAFMAAAAAWPISIPRFGVPSGIPSRR